MLAGQSSLSPGSEAAATPAEGFATGPLSTTLPVDVGQMDEREQLSAVFAARRASYSSAEVSMALLRTGSRLEFIRGVVRFNRGDTTNRDISVDFGRMILERKQIPVDSAMSPIVEALAGSPGGPRDTESVRPIQFDGCQGELFVSAITRPPWLYHLQEGLPNAVGEPRYFGWPAEFFQVVPRDANTWIDPRGPVGNSRLGVLPNPTKFIDEFIEAELSRWPGAGRALLVILPDYRARIVGVDIGERQITAQIEGGTFPPDRLFYRVAVDEREVHEAPEIGFDAASTTGSVRYSLPRAQSEVQFYLMDRESDDILDWANITTSSTWVAQEVVYSSSQGQLQRLIAQGEGQLLEFKQEVGDAKRLLQSIVAFANSGGGTILVGVADDGIPATIDPMAAQEIIERAIRQHCEPGISVEYVPVSISGADVLMVRVPRGPSPPYQYRPNGVFYVRRGRSNFPASPEEVRALVSGGN